VKRSIQRPRTPKQVALAGHPYAILVGMKGGLTIFACIALCGCYQEEWRGFVYPSKDNLLNHREIGTYSSLEECRSAALAVITNAKWQNADYECGLSCKMSDTGSGLNICDKTER
jgi:hypothetical protein